MKSSVEGYLRSQGRAGQRYQVPRPLSMAAEDRAKVTLWQGAVLTPPTPSRRAARRPRLQAGK